MATGLRFKGTVEVLVDPARLEARFRLSREGDLEYDEGALVRVLSDAGVTEGFDPEALGDVVQSFHKSKDPSAEVVVARGVAPAAPTSEHWQWNQALEPSDPKRALVTRVLKAAGPPEVHQVRIEKVKVQKKVAPKGGLFGQEPTLTTVVEEREVREKVLVDPNPLKVFWVEAGTLVASVTPARPGAPGKDLSGRMLAAPPGRHSPFYAGQGLERVAGEVIARAAGFLRVGRNWADLVTHRPHIWSLHYSEDKTSAFLSFEPGDALADPPDAGAIQNQLHRDGFDTERIPDTETLRALVEGAILEGRSLASHPLVPDRDGGFEIRFSPDRVKATLDIRKPLGRGLPFSLKDLGAALRESQIKGLQLDAVKQAVQDFLTGPHTELRDYPLATGIAPTRGPDFVLTFSVGFLPPEEVRAIQDHLLAQPRYLEALPDRMTLPPEKVEQAGPVQAGQEFARMVAPEGGGEPGVDVQGNPVAPIPGNEPLLVLLSNVRKNGDRIEAVIDGLLEVGHVGDSTALRVRPHTDAMAAVHRDDDNLGAWLTLVQGRGTGKRLDKALVDAALAAAQVKSGIDQAAVARALEAAQAGKIEKVQVAWGIPAANDLNRRVTFPQVLRLADGKRRGPIRAGERAAFYRPPSEGQFDGLDVLGNPIPSLDQEVRSLVVSEDFRVDFEDGQQVMTALKSGDLVFDGESLSIVTQVAVASVGGKAGNLKFPGEVLVAGGVETGAYIMAGNLKVRGRVGGALLSSDQNIQVADGIHGDGKAVLRAKYHVSVGFVERALIMAVGDVHIGKVALGCTFRVNGRVVQKTPGGGLQGGTAKVRLGLDVMNLGSPSGVPTVVSFGQDYLVEDQIVAEVKETDKLREAIVQLDQMMRRFTPADKDRLNSARQKKVLLMKMLDKRNLKLIYLRDKFDLHVPSQIVVRETLYPGVSIESHGRVYEPQGRRTAVRLTFNEQTGHIEEFPLD